ncbi:MAG: carboxymuconolactone decarboxylase family protein [Rhodovibrionaceae bacterium]
MTDAIPRLSFENSDPRVQELLKPVVERLDYFGEYFQVVGNNPEALLKFMEYTGAVKAPLDLKKNELLALVSCARCGGDYERIQHERLSLNSGFSRDWIGELTGEIIPAESQLDATEQKLRDLAIAVIDGGDATAALQAVIGDLGAEQALAAVLQIARFQMMCAICKVFAMKLPVPSIFEEE